VLTREQAAAFLDGLSDAGLTRLVSELMWFQVTNRGANDPGLAPKLADLKRIMVSAAREHVIDRLTGEPATDPLPGRAS
jgi:hypothetical protein